MSPRTEIVKGTTVRGFTIERKAGEGAFGAVFAARDVASGERVALKMLLDRVKLDPEQIERFKREAAFLSRVKSPHVAQMKEFFVDPTHGMILVMEFVEGELLSDLLSAGRLTIEEAIELGTHLLVGVRDLHAAKIVHRDIKPANVMIRRLAHGGHRAVIFDLGLSRALQGAGPDQDKSMMSITGAHTALGTLQYMAPEQVINARQATERSDLYAVAAILFRAVSGNEPFAGDERTIARAKLMVEAETFETGRSDPVAEGFRAFVAKAMRRRPAQRYQTAAEMMEALEELRRLSLGWGAGEKLTKEERSYRAQLPTIMPDMDDLNDIRGKMASGTLAAAGASGASGANGQQDVQMYQIPPGAASGPSGMSGLAAAYVPPPSGPHLPGSGEWHVSPPAGSLARLAGRDSSADVSNAGRGERGGRGGWIALGVALVVALGGAGYFVFVH